jgi:hypothetical protein
MLFKSLIKITGYLINSFTIIDVLLYELSQENHIMSIKENVLNHRSIIIHRF